MDFGQAQLIIVVGLLFPLLISIVSTGIFEYDKNNLQYFFASGYQLLGFIFMLFSLYKSYLLGFIQKPDANIEHPRLFKYGILLIIMGLFHQMQTQYHNISAQ